jgi:hypothetical protein
VSTPHEVMTALNSLNAQVVIERGRVRLLFFEDHPPPAALIEAARKYKEELRSILRAEEGARRDRFEERTAFLEYDAGLPRAKAEAIARLELAARRVCVQCGAEDDGKLHDYGGTLLHRECYRFWPLVITSKLANLNADLQPIAEPGSYGAIIAKLRARCPDHIEPDRWRQAIRDADSFLGKWGARAPALGWTARELFGLHAVPARPAPNYSRLSRYDETGLIWLLQGRPVVALTEATAAIRHRSGNVTTYYRKLNKPALGPLGDSLDDLGPCV